MDCVLLLHVSENDFVPEKVVTNRLYISEYENYGYMKIPLMLSLISLDQSTSIRECSQTFEEIFTIFRLKNSLEKHHLRVLNFKFFILHCASWQHPKN